MKNVIQKVPIPIKYWLLIIILTICLVCLYMWPAETILCLYIGNKIHDHWNEFVMIVISALVMALIGYILGYGLGYLFNWPEWAKFLVTMLGGICVVGVIVEEDNHKPFIWFWNKCKRPFQKRQHHMLISG